MKLAGRDAARYLDRPDPDGAGVLLYGADPMRVALKRAALLAALLGPDAGAEMRLTRIAAADLRRDPAALVDALKATGFFPGPRAVLVEDAADGQAAAITAALADRRPGDAVLVVTAAALGTGSALRKAFEASRQAIAIGIYADPPRRDEVEAAAAAAGLARIEPAALADLEALAAAIDPGDFAQFLAKLALYMRGEPAPLTPEDVAACAPLPPEAEVDELVNLAAEGPAAALAPAMRRLAGGSATSLIIAAGRHFRALYAAACAAEGPEAALARVRPPVFGPRRTRMAGQARALGPERLEAALGWIMDADLSLRSARPVPGLALVERLFVRIAMLPKG